MRRLAVLALLVATPARAEEVGEVGVDWVGNDIVVEAIADPEVGGVTCHVAYFERGLLDRLSKGDWFEDPSNASITCRQTGPIVLADGVSTSPGGEEVLSQKRSPALRTLRIKRIYDEDNRTLIYLVHAREPTDGAARMSISTVPLHGADRADR